MFLKVSWK